MKRTFAEAMAHRRSYYSIGSDSPVLDEEIVHVIREAVKNVPSAFNSQSTRIVLLLDEHGGSADERCPHPGRCFEPGALLCQRAARKGNGHAGRALAVD